MAKRRSCTKSAEGEAGTLPPGRAGGPEALAALAAVTVRVKVARPRATGRRPADPDDAGTDLPALSAGAMRRRMVAAYQARQVADNLPPRGEALHFLMTGQYHVADLTGAILRRAGRAQRVWVSTLSYNEESLDILGALADGGLIGTLGLACSTFFRFHNRELYARTRTRFLARGWRIAAAQNHCKVVCLAMAAGARLVIEGSANLRTGRNLEQMMVTDHEALHDWHAAWIAGLITAHEGDDGEAPKLSTIR